MDKDKVLNDGTTPICRCRVMYLGSSVPRGSKDGLQGIQEPLRDLYPESGRVDYESTGIDSWISVWSNGILIESVDNSRREVKKFFPIECLHFCSAVRYVVMSSTSGHNTDEIMLTKVSGTAKNLPLSQQPATTPSSSDNSIGLRPSNKINNYVNPPTLNNGDDDKNYDQVVKFLPLDSPFLRDADNSHLPLFAAILRRTTGIKVLECHAFICKHESAANALVRCCFHAYADSMYAKQIEENPYCHIGSGTSCVGGGSPLVSKRSRSVSDLDTVEKFDDNWNDSKQVVSSHDLPDLPLPLSSHRALKTHNHINYHKISSEIDADFTTSQPPNVDKFKIRLNGAPPLSKRHYIREGPINTMRPSRTKPSIHMGPSPTPGGRGGGPLVYPVMIGNHPIPFSIPTTINDTNADKILRHSLKKQKKKSKSKMDSSRSSLLVGSGPSPFPVPVNFFYMPQLSPHNSIGRYPMHLSLPPPSHQQHYLRNNIYGPLPGMGVPSSLGSTVRTRLKRVHSTKGGTAFGDYSHVFTGPEEEPIYLPTMRPITPLHGHHSHYPNNLHHIRHPPQRTNSHYVSYPVNYGTTPRRVEYRSKDKINRNSQSVLGNCASNWDEIERREETECDSSSSMAGLDKRKGHINEQAFSYSIRQEHRSKSNNLANLTVDESLATQIIDSAAGVGSSRGDDENLHNHQRFQRHSKPHVNDHDSRNHSFSGERGWVQASSHSSGHFDSQETTNDELYNGSKDSFLGYRAAGQGNEVSPLLESMSILNFNDQIILESKHICETASIKGNSEQLKSLGCEEHQTSLPAQISSQIVSDESFETKSTRKL